MKKRLVSLLIVVLMLATMLPAAFAAGIPGDALYYRGHYYYAYSDIMTWTNAKAACDHPSPHLA